MKHCFVDGLTSNGLKSSYVTEQCMYVRHWVKIRWPMDISRGKGGLPRVPVWVWKWWRRMLFHCKIPIFFFSSCIHKRNICIWPAVHSLENVLLIDAHDMWMWLRRFTQKVQLFFFVCRDSTVRFGLKIFRIIVLCVYDIRCHDLLALLGRSTEKKEANRKK